MVCFGFHLCFDFAEQAVQPGFKFTDDFMVRMRRKEREKVESINETGSLAKGSLLVFRQTPPPLVPSSSPGPSLIVDDRSVAKTDALLSQ